MANLGEGLDWLSSVNNCVLCLDPHHDWISTGGPPCSMSSHLILHVVAPHREGLFLLWDGDERLLLSECGSCFLVIQQKRSVFSDQYFFCKCSLLVPVICLSKLHDVTYTGRTVVIFVGHEEIFHVVIFTVVFEEYFFKVSFPKPSS